MTTKFVAAYKAGKDDEARALYPVARMHWERIETVANGSRGLLDEVATGKITGEEEYWSRTDLSDFQADIEGALVAFEGLRPLLRERDFALESQIAAKFAAIQALLDAHRDGDGFKTYDKLSQAEIKELSDAVNALSEPVSKLAAAVV